MRTRKAGAVATDLFCCIGCRMAAAVVKGEGAPRRFLEARLLFAAFLSMGLMEISLVLYGESLYGVVEDRSVEAIRHFGQWFSAALAVPVFLLLGVPLAKGAWLDLVRGQVRMDGLILLATAASFGLSLAHTIVGRGAVYYETATMILVLVTFGRRLETRAREQGKDAATALADLLPTDAHRVAPDGKVEDIHRDRLGAGDTVRILPGERVPADILVTMGESHVASAHLSGESRPLSRAMGDRVSAGSVNGSGLLVGIVEAPAFEGSLGRIKRLIEEPLEVSDMMRLTDRLAGHLAWTAMLLAVLGGVRSWLITTDIGEGVRTASSVLLVACPCALGLATPLAYRAMRAHLAKRGILVHDGASLERAAVVDHVVLDKTGTLTRTEGIMVDESDADPEKFVRMMALVRSSGHVLGAATLPTDAEVASVRVHAGAGVEGIVDGHSVAAGRPDWIASRSGGGTVPGDSIRSSGEDSALIAWSEDGTFGGIAVVHQVLRRGAQAAISEIIELGAKPEILSGDRERAVRAIGESLGVPHRGGVTPDEKLEVIVGHRRSGNVVLMAGDGINDAPALRAADVSLTLVSGTGMAKDVAGVEIVRDDLTAIPEFLRAARRVRRVVRGNLAWTLVYNLAAIGLATAGRLHPLLAAASMIVSSVVVSVRSYRLLDVQDAVVAPSVVDDGAVVPSLVGPRRSVSAT